MMEQGGRGIRIRPLPDFLVYPSSTSLNSLSLNMAYLPSTASGETAISLSRLRIQDVMQSISTTLREKTSSIISTTSSDIPQYETVMAKVEIKLVGILTDLEEIDLPILRLNHYAQGASTTKPDCIADGESDKSTGDETCTEIGSDHDDDADELESSTEIGDVENDRTLPNVPAIEDVVVLVDHDIPDAMVDKINVEATIGENETYDGDVVKKHSGSVQQWLSGITESEESESIHDIGDSKFREDVHDPFLTFGRSFDSLC
jgi:hypothetical protein